MQRPIQLKVIYEEKKGSEITSDFRILLSMSVTCCCSIISSLEERHFNQESDSVRVLHPSSFHV